MVEELIRNKIGKVQDLDDRRLLKDVVQEVFMDIVQYDQDRYQQLEKSVYQELSVDQTKYTIYTTVCNRNDYAYNNGFLYPMVSLDVNSCRDEFGTYPTGNPVYDIDKIKEQISQQEKVVLFNIFMECESKIIKRMLGEPANYQVEIITDQNTYMADIELSQSIKYSKPIQSLYHLFQYNKITWRTVNNPYAYKFIDVILTEMPYIEPTETIKEIIVHLGPYEQYKKTDMILLWNIKQISIEDQAFPVSIKDSDHFEHSFSLRELDITHGYFAHQSNQYLISVRHNNDKLVFISSWDKAKKWEVVKVYNVIDQKMSWLPHRLASNQRKISFVDRFAERNSQTIRTRGEIERLINGFHVADEIEFCGLEIKANKDIVYETNNLNYFIKDDIRQEKDKDLMMVLNFKAANSTFITIEQMSFLVSEIQFHFPEYCCIGILK